MWQEKLPTKVPNVSTVDIETGHAIRQLVDLALVPLKPADVLALGKHLLQVTIAVLLCSYVAIVGGVAVGAGKQRVDVDAGVERPEKRLEFGTSGLEVVQISGRQAGRHTLNVSHCPGSPKCGVVRGWAGEEQKLTFWSVEAGLAGPHMCMFGLISGRRRRVSPPNTEDLKVS